MKVNKKRNWQNKFMQNAENAADLTGLAGFFYGKDLVNLPKFQKIPKLAITNVFIRKTFVFAENTCKKALLDVN